MSTSTHLRHNLITFDQFNFANGDVCVHTTPNQHNYDGSLSKVEVALSELRSFCTFELFQHLCSIFSSWCKNCFLRRHNQTDMSLVWDVCRREFSDVYQAVAAFVLALSHLGFTELSVCWQQIALDNVWNVIPASDISGFCSFFVIFQSC